MKLTPRQEIILEAARRALAELPSYEGPRIYACWIRDAGRLSRTPSARELEALARKVEGMSYGVKVSRVPCKRGGWGRGGHDTKAVADPWVAFEGVK